MSSLWGAPNVLSSYSWPYLSKACVFIPSKYSFHFPLMIFPKCFTSYGVILDWVARIFERGFHFRSLYFCYGTNYRVCLLNLRGTQMRRRCRCRGLQEVAVDKYFQLDFSSFLGEAMQLSRPRTAKQVCCYLFCACDFFNLFDDILIEATINSYHMKCTHVC